ncbi:hypothetical protein AB0P19_14995 [Microbacterium oleivorans]|uniref:hypothetical protein n=1 Tax=Microbacterium TaxID=33882 RepID=UPI0033CE130A
MPESIVFGVTGSSSQCFSFRSTDLYVLGTGNLGGTRVEAAIADQTSGSGRSCCRTFGIRERHTGWSWIAPGNEYTTSIPNAVQKIMYPSGMSNPMVLWKTTVNSNSNMDFYQYYSSSSTEPVAKTTSHRKNANGNNYAMPVSEKDTYNWVYAEVRLNDYHMDGLTNTKREAVIVHEMLPGYGLRDLYNNANQASIMFGSISGTATRLTSDANSMLNAKY